MKDETAMTYINFLWWNAECWADVESPTFYSAFAWTLFRSIVDVNEKIPKFIEQKKIKCIPTGDTMEVVCVRLLLSLHLSLLCSVCPSVGLLVCYIYI